MPADERHLPSNSNNRDDKGNIHRTSQKLQRTIQKPQMFTKTVKTKKRNRTVKVHLEIKRRKERL